MYHIKEFDRFASQYQRYKIIQSKVATHLVSQTRQRGKRIADLGAGSGEVYRAIDWQYEKFFAVDLSNNMLRFHPDRNVSKILCNFDDERCIKILKERKVDQIFASSSLQWSKNLELLMHNLAHVTQNVAFAIFTDNTFKTLHAMLGISSPIYSKEEIVSSISQNFMVDYEVRQYRLFFPDTAQMLHYIKKSGVSAGKRVVKIKDLRRVLREYPHSYLEFEVVFAWSRNS